MGLKLRSCEGRLQSIEAGRQSAYICHTTNQNFNHCTIYLSHTFVIQPTYQTKILIIALHICQTTKKSTQNFNHRTIYLSHIFSHNQWIKTKFQSLHYIFFTHICHTTNKSNLNFNHCTIYLSYIFVTQTTYQSRISIIVC